MTIVGLISDTHSHLGEDVLSELVDCDEIWHAGDLGDVQLIDVLSTTDCIVRGVYGNIDDHQVRAVWPKDLIFTVDGLKVFMTHIGGYPGRYQARVKQELIIQKPDLYICGHSHILKIAGDEKLNLLHMNPGACGHHGFHQFRTLIKFKVETGKVFDVKVIELGRRGREESK